MNYIKQINGFWNWRMLNRVSHGGVDLYFAILHCANTAKWKPSFNIPNSTLLELTRFADNSALIKTRNKLVQSGLISYQKSKDGQAGIYKIRCLYDAGSDTEMDTVLDTNLDTETDTELDTIHKQKKNETKRNNILPISPYQEIVDMFNGICISYPKIKNISESRKKAIKARLNQYVPDDFRRLFEKAEASSFLKGGNNCNWSANFDWLIKDANMAKVLDGNYDDRASKGNNERDFDVYRTDVDYDALIQI